MVYGHKVNFHMQPYFQQLRRNLELNESFEEIIKTRHTAVRSVLENNNPSIRDTKLIGSLKRQTRIQPRTEDSFDIDILVVLGEFVDWAAIGGISPSRALQEVHSSVQTSDRYSTKHPQQDAPTVSLQFADKVKVELVPAYIDNIGRTPAGTPVPPTGRGYWIPKNGRWEHADYDFDAEYMTEQNKKSDEYLVPSIKMLKALRRVYFPTLQSFPLEIIAAQIIPLVVRSRKIQGQLIAYPDLLSIFFETAKNTLSTSLSIPGSNSPPVLIDNAGVQDIKASFDLVGAYISSINLMTSEGAKVDAWHVLFGDTFPTRV